MKPSKRFMTRKRIFTFINVLLLIGLAGAAGYFYKQYDDLKSASPSVTQLAQDQEIIDQVAKLYAVPNNEKPTAGKVSDKEAIKKQYPVLDQVENDDYLLLYEKSAIAILYRPSLKQIIKVVPFSTQSALKLKVVGGGDERTAVETILNENKLPFTDGGALKTVLNGVVVVDVSGKNAEVAKTLADRVKGSVGSVPEGEDTPTDADLVVFVGPTIAITP